ncbi:unnamed protein product, partial [Effrenium voratum]
DNSLAVTVTSGADAQPALHPEGATVEPDADGADGIVANDGAKDDEAIIEAYAAQLASLKDLDLGASDDASIAQWGRARLAKISELKAGMQNTKKSAGRRKGGSPTEFLAPLEEMIEELNALTALIKTLMSATVEGREPFEKVRLRLDTDQAFKAFEAAWERCLKGVAMEDLKTAQWDNFFSATYQLTISSLTENAGPFFVLLASQLTQRLVKTINVTKLLTREVLKYLRAFMESMQAHADTIRATTQADEDDKLAIQSILVVLDLAAPPSRVLAACATLNVALSHHWLVQAFSLEKGKRVMECARDNAQKRQDSDSLLEAFATSSSELKAIKERAE